MDKNKEIQICINSLKKTIFELEHIKNGCSFGQPSGPDDFIEDCDCPEEEEEEAI